MRSMMFRWAALAVTVLVGALLVLSRRRTRSPMSWRPRRRI
ncbi:hypothetical protein [Actinomadura sp. KC216]|nr:hypothetical protein [Actinomadura sp. KC216]